MSGYKADLEDIAMLKRLAGVKRSRSPKQTFEQVKPAPAPQPIPYAVTEQTLIAEAAGVKELLPALPFDNAVDWFTALMPEIPLHPWQYEMLMLFSGYKDPANLYDPATKVTYTDDAPLRAIIPAANGSGKDLILIAAIATWYCATAPKTKVVITSSSDDQLKTQTEPHIVELCRRANEKFGRPLFKWVEHYISFPEIKSRIKLFATNDAGRAEGEHPDHGGRMMLIVNEAKSIRPEIWDALSRCSGYSYWLEVSSPGMDNGHFYDEYQESVREKNCWPNPVRPIVPYSRRITGDDCPHIKPAQKITIAKRGEIIMRSSWYAEFTSLESETVIPKHLLHYCDRRHEDYTGPKLKTSSPKRVGLDVGAGKDATVMSVWAGNELVAEERIIEKNVISQMPWVIERLKRHGFLDCPIIGDDNGVGQGLLDALVLAKHNVIRVRNQQSAFNKSQFLNAGAEMYANLRDHAQLQNIGDLPEKVIRELTVRRWSQHNGKWKLYDKEEDKTLLDGKSPDSADAMALAWFNLRPHELAGTYDKLNPAAPKKLKATTLDDFLLQEAEQYRKQLYAGNEPDNFSLTSYINKL